MLKGEDAEVTALTLSLQEAVFDYFNLIVKDYYMSIDKWGQEAEYTSAVKAEYAKIDDELKKEEESVPVPEGLTREMAEQLLQEKEALLTNIYTQLTQMQHSKTQEANFDFEQTVLLNRTMFDDKMYVKTGYSGKDLQRAIMKLGIYD